MSEAIDTNVMIIVSALAFFSVLVFISIPYSKYRLVVTFMAFIFIAVSPIFTLFTYSHFDGLNLYKYALTDDAKFAIDLKAILLILEIIGIDIFAYFVLLIPRIVKYRGKVKR